MIRGNTPIDWANVSRRLASADFSNCTINAITSHGRRSLNSLLAGEGWGGGFARPICLPPSREGRGEEAVHTMGNRAITPIDR